MNIALITGSAGLIGAEASRWFCEQGFHVVGLDNDLRKKFFGPQASTRTVREALEATLPNYRHRQVDIRDVPAVDEVFREYGTDIRVVIHAAAQPSHEWAAKDPLTDFGVNAVATLGLLETLRQNSPQACFIFMSTNKVYGDTPNRLPLMERESRWELDPTHTYYTHGIDETMSIDQSLHSPFGASKLAADVIVQEYGRYFGLFTVCFRGGCITGPGHAGVELHGFLSYLMKCAVEGRTYSVFGYKGKQVRDNLHAYDLVQMFWQFYQQPRVGEVYNAGGGRFSNCSVQEAIQLAEELTQRELPRRYDDQARRGDHVWWISDTRKFEKHYPGWQRQYDTRRIMQEILLAVSGRV